MRTSRVSRDTSRIVAATRTLRQTRAVVNEERRRGGGTQSESELSSEEYRSPSEIEPESDIEPESEIDERPVKKRKTAPVTTSKHKIKQEETLGTIASPKAKKARRTPAKKIKREDGTVKIEPPANWEEIYALTREMRNENLAPVDTMGCESLADRERTPRDQRFQTLVALMLSSQTKDTVTAVAMRNMQENMPGVRFCLLLSNQHIMLTYNRASILNLSSRSHLQISTP
jgi:endonuclease-3